MRVDGSVLRRERPREATPAGRQPVLLAGRRVATHLLTELCESLADEQIRVLTGVSRGHEQLPRREVRNGVEIVRVSSTAFERANLGLRALNYASYIGSSLLQGLTGSRPDLVLCMTDPPAKASGSRHRKAVRRAVPRHLRGRSPEIATSLGVLNCVLVATLRQLIGLI